jgi:hypothetical protein
MDTVSADLSRLLDEPVTPPCTDEQLARIREVLHYDQYVPDATPDDATTAYTNPAVDGYREWELDWGPEGWMPEDDISVTRQYPDYVPTDSAIDVLLNLSPLVEVGAGDGYWSYVIEQNGGSVRATDLNPTRGSPSLDPLGETFPVEYHRGPSLPDADDGFTRWCPVHGGDGSEVVAESDRPVLLVHPEPGTRWPERVLDSLDDQPLVFVGEWFPGYDASPMFFHRLHTEFDLVETFPVYDWASMHARGYVFEQSEAV